MTSTVNMTRASTDFAKLSLENTLNTYSQRPCQPLHHMAEQRALGLQRQCIATTALTEFSGAVASIPFPIPSFLDSINDSCSSGVATFGVVVVVVPMGIASPRAEQLVEKLLLLSSSVMHPGEHITYIPRCIMSLQLDGPPLHST